MSPTKVKYCFDSSSFINSWSRHYPPSVFGQLWELLAGLIRDDRLILCKEVEKEIIAGDDDLKNWLRQNKECVQAYSSEQIEIVSKIVNKYPKVSQYQKTRPNHADPFVIALAKQTNSIVVTEEKPNGSNNNPSIPDLCKEFGIEYIDLVGLLKKEKWSFNAIK